MITIDRKEAEELRKHYNTMSRAAAVAKHYGVKEDEITFTGNSTTFYVLFTGETEDGDFEDTADFQYDNLTTAKRIAAKLCKKNGWTAQIFQDETELYYVNKYGEIV